MKRLALLSLSCLLAAPALAQADTVELQTSKINVTFHISHPAKEFDSFLTPDGGLGVITLDPKAMENTKARFTIKVDHFSSDNTRRDSHMIETMEALVFPTIEWDVQSVDGATGPWTPGVHSFKAKGPIQIHGVTRDLEVPVEITVGGKGEITFGSNFSVALEEFEIERPTLVFVPIENDVPVIVKVDTKPNPELLAAAAEPVATDPPPAEAGEEGAEEAAPAKSDAETVEEPAKNE